MGGFSENFSKTEFFFRFCLFSQTNLRNKECCFKDLRNPDNYESLINHLEKNRDKKIYYGVKKKITFE